MLVTSLSQILFRCTTGGQVPTSLRRGAIESAILIEVLDAPAKRVLQAFDELECDLLDLATLSQHANTPVSSSELPCGPVEELVEQLVRGGWLRPTGSRNRLARTEQGRLAVARPRDVTLYTRPGCHLCEEAKAQMLPLLARFGARLREVNIESDEVLSERYGLDVPVVFLGPRKVAKHRIDPDRFQRQLAGTPP